MHPKEDEDIYSRQHTHENKSDKTRKKREQGTRQNTRRDARNKTYNGVYTIHENII